MLIGITKTWPKGVLIRIIETWPKRRVHTELEKHARKVC